MEAFSEQVVERKLTLLGMHGKGVGSPGLIGVFNCSNKGLKARPHDAICWTQPFQIH